MPPLSVAVPPRQWPELASWFFGAFFPLTLKMHLQKQVKRIKDFRVMFAVLSCALQAIHLPQKSQCRLQILQIFLSTHGTVLYTSLVLAELHSSFLAFSA